MSDNKEQEPFILRKRHRLSGTYGMMSLNPHFEYDTHTVLTIGGMSEDMRYLEYLSDPNNDPAWLNHTQLTSLGFKKQGGTIVYQMDINHELLFLEKNFSYKMFVNNLDTDDVSSVNTLLKLKDTEQSIAYRDLKHFMEHNSVISIHSTTESDLPLIAMATLLPGGKKGRCFCVDVAYKDPSEDIVSLLLVAVINAAKCRAFSRIILPWNSTHNNEIDSWIQKSGFTRTKRAIYRITQE